MKYVLHSVSAYVGIMSITLATACDLTSITTRTTFSTNSIQSTKFTWNIIKLDCALAQAVSCRLLTTEARVQLQASACGICGGPTSTGIGYLRLLFATVSTTLQMYPTHSLIPLQEKPPTRIQTKSSIWCNVSLYSGAPHSNLGNEINNLDWIF